jgi:hypothetical protein
MGNFLTSLSREDAMNIVIGYDLIALSAGACLYNNIKQISYNYYKNWVCKEHMKVINQIEWFHWLSGCLTGVVGMQLFDTLLRGYLE